MFVWSSEEDDKIFHSDSIKDSLQAPEDLTEVEGDERQRKVITCFHNTHGFDGNFILEALYKQGRAVEKPLTQGAKILYFEPGNLIFKNSMNFFAMALDKFPSTFHLQELHKGFFLTPSTKNAISIILASTPQSQVTILMIWIPRNGSSFSHGTESC